MDKEEVKYAVEVLKERMVTGKTVMKITCGKMYGDQALNIVLRYCEEKLKEEK
jgi:hypothetical protein